MDAKSRALEVPCPFCGADIGQSCVENGQPFPPHRGRVIAVQDRDDAPSLTRKPREPRSLSFRPDMVKPVQQGDVEQPADVPAAPPQGPWEMRGDAPMLPPVHRFSVRTINETYRGQRVMGDDDQTARARTVERLRAIYGEAPTEAEIKAVRRWVAPGRP